MIVFLSGEDEFRSRLCLEKHRFDFLSGLGRDASLSVFDVRDESVNLSLVRGACVSTGLFSEKSVVVCVDFLRTLTTGTLSELFDFLEVNSAHLFSQEVLLIFWERGSVRKNTKIYKFLTKNASSVEVFDKLYGVALERWVRDRFSYYDSGLLVDVAAVRLLVLSSTDLFALDGFVQKIVSYACGERVTSFMVSVLVPTVASVKIFDALDALGRGEKRQSLELVHGVLDSGEDPYYVFAMLVFQLRVFVKVASVSRRGATPETMRIAGVQPFVFKKALSSPLVSSPARLLRAYKLLCDYDVRVKTGDVDVLFAIDRFVFAV
ncbi:MAG: hypothetical protein KC736_04455 [Candidatus Moranbacteria bacterium]|nr:hypothetical protein [Candidatus Moranbacteria bacterium]